MAQLVRMATNLRMYGVLHRDVKPDNICLRTRGGSRIPLILIDFGKATPVQDVPGRRRMRVVAECYRAPEL